MEMDNIDLHALAWQTSQLPIVLELLARKRNLLPHAGVTAPSAPESLSPGNDEALAQWMDRAADELGIEIEPMAIAYAEVDQFARAAAPALLQLPNQGDCFVTRSFDSASLRSGCAPRNDSDAPRFLAIVKEGTRHVSIIDPDLKVRRIRFDIVRDLSCVMILESIVLGEHAINCSALGNHHRDSHPAPHASRAKRLPARRLSAMGTAHPAWGNGWILRLAPGATLWRQARHEHLFGLLLRYLGINAVQKGLELGAWFILGATALAGNLDRAWLVAWALFLLSASACRMPAQHVRGAIREKIMGIKQWLIYNALKLDPDKVRHQGAGQFLGCIMASGTMEDRIGSSSVMILVCVVELSMITVLLALGAGGWLHAGLLVGWTAVTFLIGWRYYRYGKRWNATYHQMTSDLAERMVGHRTRLAQEDRARWHTDEDTMLGNYLLQSEQLDGIDVQLKALVSRGWMVIGLAGIAYPFIFAEPSQAQLLLGLGGILLASASLQSLVDHIIFLVWGLLAWQQVESLVQAAVTEGANVAPMTRKPAAAPDGKVPVLTARNLVFRFRDRGRTILDACNLRIQEGDRVLLEGPSGGGKSTLAALLAGLRTPQSGLVLLKSLDRQTIGNRRVAAQSRRGPAVSREPHLHRDLCVQLVDGSSLASHATRP